MIKFDPHLVSQPPPKEKFRPPHLVSQPPYLKKTFDPPTSFWTIRTLHRPLLARLNFANEKACLSLSVSLRLSVSHCISDTLFLCFAVSTFRFAPTRTAHE